MYEEEFNKTSPSFSKNLFMDLFANLGQKHEALIFPFNKLDLISYSVCAITLLANS